jgi:hypothetical protein
MQLNLNIFFGSSLPGGQKRWHWLVGILFALLLANTLFLLARRYGFGCSLNAYDLCSVSVFYQAAVLVHSLLGILLVLGALGFIILHIPKNLEAAKRRLQLPSSGVFVIVSLSVLLWSGIYFLFNAKRAEMNWLYNTHRVVAAAIVLLYFGHRAMSAHRFSSFNNPFYVATIQYLRNTPVEPNEFVEKHLTAFGLPNEATGQVKSRWCAGCHDPLINLSGRMAGDIDKGGVEAQGGLICLSCHAIKEIPGHLGNGNYVWNDEFKDSYIFSGVASGPGAKLHDTYLKANPERHKADMLKPFYRQSEFCATCHKVALERPVNDYRWLRGQNEYDNWHNSGMAHNAARTFYLPPKVR